MNYSSIYKSWEKVEVPTVRDSEPASSALAYIRKVRFNRERDFQRSRIRTGHKDTGSYLESLKL